jgi:hypothetical protein
MHVELMDGQEVFGRHADDVTSQPHSGYLREVTENIGNRGKLRQLPRLKAWHTHGNTLPGGEDFYPELPEVGNLRSETTTRTEI